ncbi:MAG: hypothetical protein ACRCWR_09110 [Saezia sp.]
METKKEMHTTLKAKEVIRHVRYVVFVSYCMPIMTIFIGVLIFWPLLFFVKQIVGIPTENGVAIGFDILFYVITLLPAFLIGYSLWFRGIKQPQEKETFFQRYKPEIYIILFTSALCCLFLLLTFTGSLSAVPWLLRRCLFFIFEIPPVMKGSSLAMIFLCGVSRYIIFGLGVMARMRKIENQKNRQ